MKCRENNIQSKKVVLVLALFLNVLSGCAENDAKTGCDNERPCAAGLACVVGHCTGPCESELDCPAGALCNDGVCAKVCETHEECLTEGANYACVSGLCESVAAPGWLKVTGPSEVNELETITLSAKGSYVTDAQTSKIVWKQIDVGDLPPFDAPILPDAGPDGTVVGDEVRVRAPKLVQDVVVSVSATLVAADGKQLSVATLLLFRNTINEAPIASAAAYPHLVRPGSVVRLTAERSFDPNPLDSLTYLWSYQPTSAALEVSDDVGDGSFRLARVVAPSSFNDITVTFMVEVNDGKTSTMASVDVLFLGTGAGCKPDVPGDCDDGNVCTTDRCLVTGECEHLPTPGSCEDGNPCTTDDTCGDGQCVGAGVTNCDDNNRCTQDGCDITLGCIYSPVAGVCDDENQCTEGDRCLDGDCQPGKNICPCSLNVDCVAFDDGDLCNGMLVCDALVGVCVLAAGSVVTCERADLQNECAVSLCNPTNGQCEQLPTAVGSPCDDGNACTSSDACVSGLCVGLAPKDCDDNDVCTDDACDPQTGCKHSQNDKLCDDGNVCTTDDRCSPQGCKGQVKSPCDDGNPCTNDGCSPAAGCVHKPNTFPCNDGNVCTVGDICLGGTCIADGKLVCDDGNPCTADGCDVAVGCVHINASSPCNDGSLCTSGDYCDGGVCQPGANFVCDDGDPCTTDGCDAAVGCVHNTTTTGVCEDGNPCTTGDSCVAGVCVGGVNDCHCVNNGGCVAAGSPCVGQMKCVAGLCQPVVGTAIDCSSKKSGVCTTWVCDDNAGGCVIKNVTKGVVCDDGNACTQGDVCQAKGCVGNGAVCDDKNVCTADVCDPQKGCVFTSLSGGCEDGSACTKGDYCTGGVCVGGAPVQCDDGNKCTTENCNPLIGCVAVHNTLPCSDGDPCTIADQCNGGTCIGGPTILCGDGNPCTTDTCVSGTGCVFTATTGSCDDGNACTIGDVCQDGACVGGPPPQCVAGPCFTSACSPTVGCVTVWGSWACSDNNPCTVGDKCAQGECIGGTVITCDDKNPCTADWCNPTKGCDFQAVDGPCDDGIACTTQDSCQNGLCVPKQVQCGCDHDEDCVDDDNLCNGVPVCDLSTNTCVPKVGTAIVCPNKTSGACVNLECDPNTGTCVGIPAVQGTPCDDENLCTQGDSCGVGGVCHGGPSVLCNDNNTCTADLCDAQSGCQFANLTGTLCSDGDACTTDDTCFQGGCVANQGVGCDDGNPCTADACVAGTGCVHVGVPSACNDDNACTVGDFCVLGICLAGTPFSCDDGNGCTTDECSPTSGCIYKAANGFCDDGNNCTTGDVCVAKVCQKGQPVVCNDNNPCTNDVCASASGCTYLPNTLPCDDNNLCTGEGQCQAGICLAGKPVVCDDNNPCTTESCNPAAGCTAVDNTAICDDNNPCTFGDTCTGGQCQPGMDACLNCVSDADCGALDDANPCNGTLVCVSDGPSPTCEIAKGSVINCAEAVGGCLESVCDPVLGECLLQAVNEGTACDDGDACTIAEHCVDGACVVTSPFGCFAKNTAGCAGCDCEGCVCGKDPFCCEIAWDTVCVKACVEDCGQLCDSNAQGTLGCVTSGTPGCGGCECETCVCKNDPYCCVTAWDLSCVQKCTATCGQECVDPVTIQCDDSNPCTVDLCDKLTGCVAVKLPDGAFCNDGNACNLQDQCFDGQCIGNDVGLCDDGNPCTHDKCVAGTCVNEFNTLACDDGNVCTVGDVCKQGVCTPGGVLPCSGSEACSTAICDATLGCLSVAVPVGTPCLNQQNLCGGQGQCKKWDTLSFAPEPGAAVTQRYALLSVTESSGALTAVGAAWDVGGKKWGGTGYVVEFLTTKSAKVVFKHPTSAMFAIHGTMAVGEGGATLRRIDGKWAVDEGLQDALGVNSPLVAVWTGLVGSPVTPWTDVLLGMGETAGVAPMWSCLLTGNTAECAHSWNNTEKPLVAGISATTGSAAGITQESLFTDRAWLISNGVAGKDGLISPQIWASQLDNEGAWTNVPPFGCSGTKGICADVTVFRDIIAVSNKEVWASSSNGVIVRFDGTEWTTMAIAGLADGLAANDIDIKAMAKVGTDLWLAAETPGCGAGLCVADPKTKSHLLLHLNTDKNTWFKQRILNVRTCPGGMSEAACNAFLSRFVISDMAVTASDVMGIVGADTTDGDASGQVMQAYLVELK